MQWIRQGNVWMMLALPCVTVEAFGSSGGQYGALASTAG